MRPLPLVAILILAAACGGSQASRHPQELDPDRRFARRAECEQLVEHLDGLLLMSRRISALDYARRTQNERRQLVDRCTISVSKRQYDCLMASHSREQANFCWY